MSQVRLSFAAPLAVIAIAMTAPAAHAAKVTVERSDDGIVYISVAGGAEPDVLTVSSPSPGVYAVTQAPGLPLTVPGNSCTTVGPTRVECAVPGLAGALLVGGDGDDRLTVSGTVGQGSWLFGTNGADELIGGPGADRLDGGQGADVLRARDGRLDDLYCGTEGDAFDVDDVDTVAPDCETRLAPDPAAPPVPADPLAGAGSGPMPLPELTPITAPAPAPVDISTAPVKLSHRAVPMRVSCTAAADCTGSIVIRMLPRRAGHTAVAAGARRPVVARQRYRVAAGKSKSLRVHISRRGRTRVLERRKARCSVRISTVAPDGTTQVRKRKITIRAGGGR